MANQEKEKNHSDISHLIEAARDVFDMQSWGGKESEPAPAPREDESGIEVHEYVEHEPAVEVKEHVEDRKPNPQIPDDLKDMGVEETEDPVQYPTAKSFTLPISDEKFAAGFKKPVSSAYRWMVETYKYLMKKAGVDVTIKDGHVKREKAQRR